MTLQQFFQLIQEHPIWVVYFYGALLLGTLLLNALSEREGHLYPWNYGYATLVYLVCVPGIFAVTLNVYFFLFEKRPLMEADLLIQALPVLMLFVIVYLIRRNVSLDDVPGFDKLYSLVVILGILLSLMWVVDRTQLYAISFVPFYYVLLFLIAALFVIRQMWKRMLG